MPTVDDLSALARSGPWLCTRVHFTHRSVEQGRPQVVEAWLERPGRLRVLDGSGTRVWVDNQETGSPGRAPDPGLSWGRDMKAARRPDGLLKERPPGTGGWGEFEIQDPMYENYEWVAMLDPLELSSGIAWSNVRETHHHGRLAWAGRAVPQPDYEALCPCCPLLWGEVSEQDEHGDEYDPTGVVFPTAYDVVLDHGTGIVVGRTPVWPSGVRPDRELGFDVQIRSAS